MYLNLYLNTFWLSTSTCT